MFLTQKALKRIRLLVGVYCGIGAFCLIVSIIFVYFDIETRFLAVLGAIALLLGVVFRKFGRYAEGKGKLLNLGNKLVCRELRPAEFIKAYEQARDCIDNVISKPDFDVLKMVTTAYDCMGETERALETIEQMQSIASEGMKPIAIIFKSSMLYGLGRVEEAEELYSQAVNMELNFAAKSAMEALMKLDRAVALKDYTTAEAYGKQLLNKTFPKNTPLTILVINFTLAEICYKTDRLEETKSYLEYCVENGGETVIKTSASDMLKELC